MFDKFKVNLMGDVSSTILGVIIVGATVIGIASYFMLKK